VVQEESEIKWGALLGVVALTTNQPYFATVVATGDRKRPWVLCVSSVAITALSFSQCGVMRMAEGYNCWSVSTL
jgi:hypothetical protein